MSTQVDVDVDVDYMGKVRLMRAALNGDIKAGSLSTASSRIEYLPYHFD